MRIKSIYKNKGSKAEMKNRRGIFLTSVVGKIFEKAMLQEVESQIKLDKHQNGGRKQRSTKDNWLALMSVIDKNKEVKRDTVLVFVDAEKCFDKLWLEDCIIDIAEGGLREREAALLYNLNTTARITVITPSGSTEEFEAKHVVKQGTIFVPVLCCSSTGKINQIGEVCPETAVSPNMAVGTPIFCG